MRGRRGRFDRTSRCLRLAFSAGIFAVFGFLVIGFAPRGKALPSYARQTGQPIAGSCHTDFAGLTPYGRLFKIGGYTAGGGPYRTTLFPGSEDSPRNSYVPPLLAKAIASSNTSDQSDRTWVPPISTMAIVGFTHTQAPLPPPTAPYNANDNVVGSPISFFYGGAITDHIGAFQQLTYNAPPPGRFGTDPFRHAHLDLGQYRYPLCKLDEPRQFCCYLRHHRKQQSHRPGPLEYHARLGLPLRRVDPGQRFRAHDDHRRRLCGACRQRRRLCVCQRPALPRGVGLSHARPPRAEFSRDRSFWRARTVRRGALLARRL